MIEIGDKIVLNKVLKKIEIAKILGYSKQSWNQKKHISILELVKLCNVLSIDSEMICDIDKPIN